MTKSLNSLFVLYFLYIYNKYLIWISIRSPAPLSFNRHHASGVHGSCGWLLKPDIGRWLEASCAHDMSHLDSFPTVHMAPLFLKLCGVNMRGISRARPDCMGISGTLNA